MVFNNRFYLPSFLWLYVIFLIVSESVLMCYRLIIYELPFEVRCQEEGEGWDRINWFNPATSLCLF